MLDVRPDALGNAKATLVHAHVDFIEMKRRHGRPFDVQYLKNREISEDTLARKY